MDMLTGLIVIAGGRKIGVTYGYASGSIYPGLVVTCNTNQNTCVTTTAADKRRRKRR